MTNLPPSPVAQRDQSKSTMPQSLPMKEIQNIPRLKGNRVEDDETSDDEEQEDYDIMSCYETVSICTYDHLSTISEAGESCCDSNNTTVEGGLPVVECGCSVESSPVGLDLEITPRIQNGKERTSPPMDMSAYCLLAQYEGLRESARKARPSFISLTTGEEVTMDSDDEFTLVSCSTESLGALTLEEEEEERKAQELSSKDIPDFHLGKLRLENAIEGGEPVNPVQRKEFLLQTMGSFDITTTKRVVESRHVISYRSM